MSRIPSTLWIPQVGASYLNSPPILAMRLLQKKCEHIPGKLALLVPTWLITWSATSSLRGRDLYWVHLHQHQPARTPTSPPSQHPPSPNPLLFSAPVNWSRHHPATHALQLQMIECFNQLPFLPNWHENKTHINMSYHQQSTIPFAELDQIPPLAAAAKPPLSSHDKQRIASSNLHSCLILPPPSKWPPAIHACPA